MRYDGVSVLICFVVGGVVGLLGSIALVHQASYEDINALQAEVQELMDRMDELKARNLEPEEIEIPVPPAPKVSARIVEPIYGRPRYRGRYDTTDVPDPPSAEVDSRAQAIYEALKTIERDQKNILADWKESMGGMDYHPQCPSCGKFFRFRVDGDGCIIEKVDF